MTSKENLPDWLKIPDGYSAEMNGERISVYNDETPELFMELSLNGERNPATSFAKKFDEFKQSSERYSDATTLLAEQYNLQTKREDGRLIVTIPESDFEYTIYPTNNPQAAFANLTTLEEAIDAKSYESIEKREELKKLGFDISEKETDQSTENKIITISHEKLTTQIEIALRGELEFINNSDIAKIDSAIAEIGKEQSENAPQKNKPKKTKNPSTAALEGQNKAALVLDANAIFSLASKREDGRSWLDILPFTANLPTIDKIFIPASVADWELRGGVSYVDEQGQLQFEQFRKDIENPKNIQGAVTPAIKEFLNIASRWVYDGNGEGHLIRGTNPNIIIYESEFDHHFLKDARSINDNHDFLKYKDKIKEQIRQNTGIENCDIGEYAMEQVAKEVSKHCETFLVSDDAKYLNAKSTSDHNNHRQQNTYNIGKSSVYGLVSAVLSEYADELRTKLNNKYSSNISRPITWDVIKSDINKSGWRGGHYPDSLCVPSVAGRHGLHIGKTLEDHIEFAKVIQNLVKEKAIEPAKELIVPVEVQADKSEQIKEIRGKMLELFEHNGKKYSQSEIAEASGVPTTAISMILGEGKTNNLPSERTLREHGKKLSGALSKIVGLETVNDTNTTQKNVAEMSEGELKLLLFNAMFEQFISVTGRKNKISLA